MSRKCSAENVSLAFGQVLLNLRKNVSENRFKESSLVYLFNKQNHTWLLVGIKFLLSCSTLYFTRLLGSLAERKLHVYAHPCMPNPLYLIKLTAIQILVTHLVKHSVFWFRNAFLSDKKSSSVTRPARRHFFMYNLVCLNIPNICKFWVEILRLKSQK